MARPSKYPVRHMVRISHDHNSMLMKRAKLLGLTIGETLRVLTEHGLKAPLNAVRGDHQK